MNDLANDLVGAILCIAILISYGQGWVPYENAVVILLAMIFIAVLINDT